MTMHPLIKSFVEFKGNARGCVYTEVLNAMPINLYAPFISVYMLALGVNESQIGLLVSIGWVFQLVLAIFSGVITDKMGRRLATLVFDIFAWTIPAILSAVAQNFWYFLAGTFFTSFFRITQTSWTCLMVEDAEQDQLIDIFSWIYISGLVAGFFAPISSLMIKSLSLIPAVRILYVFAAVCFTVKAVLTYIFTEETKQGRIRMQQMRDVSIFSSFKEYRTVIPDILRAPRTLYTAGIIAIMSVCTTINSTFWSIIATKKLQLPAEDIAYFPFVSSIVMLLFYFLVIPRLHKVHFRPPMIAGFASFILSQAILILAPSSSFGWLFVSIFFESAALATLSPLIDQMTVLTIDPAERARIQSVLYVSIILVTSPFGWIAGQLSTANKNFPFVMNILLLGIGIFLVSQASRVSPSAKPSV